MKETAVKCGTHCLKPAGTIFDIEGGTHARSRGDRMEQGFVEKQRTWKRYGIPHSIVSRLVNILLKAIEPASVIPRSLMDTF
jgi:hypothetical protein